MQERLVTVVQDRQMAPERQGWEGDIPFHCHIKMLLFKQLAMSVRHPSRTVKKAEDLKLCLGRNMGLCQRPSLRVFNICMVQGLLEGRVWLGEKVGASDEALGLYV